MAYINDPYFKTFANKLSSEIKAYGAVPKDKEGLLEYQKKQMEELFSLENKFRKTLIKNRRGFKIYGEFIKYITKEKRNILVARPFFRERHEIFNKISKALKENRPKGLFKYKVNYNFIMFALEKLQLSSRHELVQIKDRIEQLRTDLVILNMPLAINRSKRFFSKTPTSHLTYMDIIQISTEGLLAAIDKFVPPFSSTFRAVIIGRITGENIFSYCADSMTILQLSDNTTKPICSIVPGDKIYGVDIEGNKIETEIVKLHDHGKMQGYEVEFDDGYKIVCSENHKFLTKQGMVAIKDIVNDGLEVLSESTYQEKRKV